MVGKSEDAGNSEKSHQYIGEQNYLMGTSSSSSGPASRVSLIPPWVPDIDAQKPEENQDSDSPESIDSPGLIAPRARFGDARREFGKFAQSGDKEALRRGLASYVAKGLGGSQNATRRMGGVARRAGILFDTLEGLRTGTSYPEKIGFTKDDLSTLPAEEIIDKLAKLVSLSDGTQDTESGQRAIWLALSDLLEDEPMLDITSLTEEQIYQVLERCIVHEIVQRIELDFGKTIIEKPPSITAVSERIKDMEEYVETAVAAGFRSYQQKSNFGNKLAVEKLMNEIIRDVFAVFGS